MPPQTDNHLLQTLAQVEGFEDVLFAGDVIDEAVGDDIGEGVVVLDLVEELEDALSLNFACIVHDTDHLQYLDRKRLDFEGI